MQCACGSACGTGRLSDSELPVSRTALADLAGTGGTLAAESGTVEISNCERAIESLAEKTKFGNGRLEEGDLVAVEVAAYDPKIAVGDDANYFLIVAKLMPVLSVSAHMFRVCPPDENR